MRGSPRAEAKRVRNQTRTCVEEARFLTKRPFQGEAVRLFRLERHFEALPFDSFFLSSGLSKLRRGFQNRGLDFSLLSWIFCGVVKTGVV